MKVGWPKVPLGELCVARTGSEDPAKRPLGEFVYVDISSVDAATKSITGARTLSADAAPSRARRKIYEDDILVSMTRPNLNAVAKVPPSLAGEICSTGFAVLRAGPKLDPDYLFHFVQTTRFVDTLAGLTAGALYPAVTEAQVRQQPIPLPPLAEQRRIVDILDRAAAIQRLRRAAEEKAREIIPSLFVDMFGDPATNPKGWPVVSLKDVAGIGSGVTKGRRIDGRKVIEVPYLRVANVQDGFLDLNEIKTITIMENEREKYALLPGDIVMTEGGDLDKLGRGYVWSGELPYCAHQNHVFRVRPNLAALDPMFLASFIQSFAGKAYFLRVAKRTTGIASINKTQLGDMPLWRPPRELQRQFGRRVSAIKAVSSLHGDAAATSQGFAGALAARLLG